MKSDPKENTDVNSSKQREVITKQRHMRVITLIVEAAKKSTFCLIQRMRAVKEQFRVDWS